MNTIYIIYHVKKHIVFHTKHASYLYKYFIYHISYLKEEKIIIHKTDIFSTSFVERNHEYCNKLAFAKSTGMHPESMESNNDFLVGISPGGCKQNILERGNACSSFILNL